MFEHFVPPPEPTVSVVPKRDRKRAEEDDAQIFAELVEVEHPVAVKQPTGHPTTKMAAVGIGGGALAVVIGWLQARFGIEFIEEDVALIMLIGPFVAGYFTKERR